MTPTEFSAWLARRGLSHEKAVPLLAAKNRNEVYRWATGKRTVPDRVAMIAELRDELDYYRSMDLVR